MGGSGKPDYDRVLAHSFTWSPHTRDRNGTRSVSDRRTSWPRRVDARRLRRRADRALLLLCRVRARQRRVGQRRRVATRIGRTNHALKAPHYDRAVVHTIDAVVEAVVRAVREEEWEALRSVRLAALATDPDAFLSSAAIERADVEDLWRARTHVRALAWRADQPIGLIGWSRHDGYLEVVGLWVHPDDRGIGVADRLVEFVLENIAKPDQDVRLGVISMNTRALRFYERVGFGVTHREPHPNAGELTWMSLQR
jgi:ribosomal protein S18 acetylase RimI-like enzyme